MQTKKNRESINALLINVLPGIIRSVEAEETAWLLLAKLLPSVLSVKLPILEKLEAVQDIRGPVPAGAEAGSGSGSRQPFWLEHPWKLCKKVFLVEMRALCVMLIRKEDPFRMGKLLDLKLSSCFSGFCLSREQGRCCFDIPVKNILKASLIWAELPVHNQTHGCVENHCRCCLSIPTVCQHSLWFSELVAAFLKWGTS